VDVVPTNAGMPSTLNPLPRHYREFQSHSRGNTANAATMSLFRWHADTHEWRRQIVPGSQKVTATVACRCRLL